MKSFKVLPCQSGFKGDNILNLCYTMGCSNSTPVVAVGKLEKTKAPLPTKQSSEEPPKLQEQQAQVNYFNTDKKHVINESALETMASTSINTKGVEHEVERRREKESYVTDMKTRQVNEESCVTDMETTPSISKQMNEISQDITPPPPPMAISTPQFQRKPPLPSQIPSSCAAKSLRKREEYREAMFEVLLADADEVILAAREGRKPIQIDVDSIVAIVRARSRHVTQSPISQSFSSPPRQTSVVPPAQPARSPIPASQKRLKKKPYYSTSRIPTGKRILR